MTIVYVAEKTQHLKREKMNIFKYSDYKIYINDVIDALPGKGRGVKKDIASTLNCMPAYVSQVLSGEAHFNLEQADALSTFFKLDKTQSRFLLLLVQYARSGTQGLKNHFEELIREEKNKVMKLKNYYNPTTIS